MKLLISLLFLFGTINILTAAPEPALVQGPQEWTLDVQFEHLRQIMLRSEKDNRTQRYWYIILTVTNNTGDEVVLYPECEMMTDTFQITPAGKNVPNQVFGHIKTRHQRMFPFIEPLKSGGMRILQGSDHTKDIAVIWPDFDKQAKQVKLFISGLSNETAAVEIPAGDGQQATKALLRKTLELDYNISGDPAFRANPKLTFEAKTWIMR